MDNTWTAPSAALALPEDLALSVVGGFRLGEQAENIANHLLTAPRPSLHGTPGLRLNRHRASLRSPVLAAHVWPPGFACLNAAKHSVGPDVGPARPGHSLRETDQRCRFPGKHPSPRPSQREERGDPGPKDQGWAPTLQRALCVCCRRQGGPVVGGQEAEVSLSQWVSPGVLYCHQSSSC